MFEVAGHGDVGAVQQTHGGPAGTDGGPAATVVIATRNRGPELCHTLQRLAGLPERPPVVVVDNGSQDGTPAIVRRRFPATQLIALRRNRGAWARNRDTL